MGRSHSRFQKIKAENKASAERRRKRRILEMMFFKREYVPDILAITAPKSIEIIVFFTPNSPPDSSHF